MTRICLKKKDTNWVFIGISGADSVQHVANRLKDGINDPSKIVEVVPDKEEEDIVWKAEHQVSTLVVKM